MYAYDRTAARRKAPKLPSSVDAPSWALKELQSKLNVAMSSLYPPVDYVTKSNTKLRDQKWGVSIPFPAGYQGKASLQIQSGSGLRKDSGEAELSIYADVVNSNLPGGSKDVPVKSIKLYLWWEKDDGGYKIVAKVDKSKPNMDAEKARLQKTASYDRRTSAMRDGPVGRALLHKWNDLHDLESLLEDAQMRYDSAASYKGKPGERPAWQMVKHIAQVMRELRDLANSGGSFDKLQKAEEAFVKQFGEPDDYADRVRSEIYPR